MLLWQGRKTNEQQMWLGSWTNKRDIHNSTSEIKSLLMNMKKKTLQVHWLYRACINPCCQIISPWGALPESHSPGCSTARLVLILHNHGISMLSVFCWLLSSVLHFFSDRYLHLLATNVFFDWPLHCLPQILPSVFSLKEFWVMANHASHSSIKAPLGKRLKCGF